MLGKVCLVMLILSRRVHEVICIGKDIEVIVTSIQGEKVRLGIVAPEGVEVDRQEVRIVKERPKTDAR